VFFISMNSVNIDHSPSSANGSLVSVAMCTHNGESFIEEQIESICKQDLPPWEVIISDDASTDRSIQIAEEVFARFPPVTFGGARAPSLKILKNARPLRVTKNFEQAVLACSGDLIALCDQDDKWHQEKLAVMRAEFERRPELLLLHTDARLIDAAGLDLKESLFEGVEARSFELDWVHQGRALDAFMRRNLATGATTMIRRTLLPYALPFPPEWLHDEWLAVIAAVVGRVDLLERELIEYRQHATNQVGARRQNWLEKVRKAFAVRDDTLLLRAAKFEVLHQRLVALGDVVSPAVLALVREKATHQRFRADLPSARWRRWWPVFCEALTGRYHRFGRPVHNLARDLLESG
jgi:glycosyltransferase involved in cell wall biosynthesis